MTESKPEAKSTTGTSITSPPPQGNQQVCVVLQPPLPSLANRSGSPTHLGTLSDNVRSSVPIILAPSPEVNKKAVRAVPIVQEPESVQNNENDQPIREESNIDGEIVNEDGTPQQQQLQQQQPSQPPPTSPPKKAIYDI